MARAIHDDGATDAPLHTNKDDHQMTSITYGDYSFALDGDGAVPSASVASLAKYGLAHALGNVAASAVSARIAKEAPDSIDMKDDAVRKAFFVKFRADNADLVASWLKEARDSIADDIKAGTMGEGRGGGPKKDPFVVMVEQLAADELRPIYRKWPGVKPNAAFPKPTDVCKTPDGVELTGQQLLDRWINGQDRKGLYGPAGAQNHPRLEKEANRRLKMKADKEAKAQAAEVGGSLDDLM